VATVDSSGTCTTLADFSDSETYPYGVWGVATDLDGTIYAVTIDRLVQIGLDGSVTELATWTCDFEDYDAHQLAAASLAIDPVTHEIGLFDYFGGFATWTADGGLVVHKKGDYNAPDLYTSTGAHRDGGGWYAPGVSATGYGVYHWDDAAGDWALDDAWTDEDWSPFMLAIDGDSGDAYVTANAGWFYTVWRIIPGSGFAADLYATDGTEDNRAFQGIVADY
jgi:hypothetical protein